MCCWWFRGSECIPSAFLLQVKLSACPALLFCISSKISRCLPWSKGRQLQLCCQVSDSISSSVPLPTPSSSSENCCQQLGSNVAYRRQKTAFERNRWRMGIKNGQRISSIPLTIHLDDGGGASTTCMMVATYLKHRSEWKMCFLMVLQGSV